jgi:hypothetical protein
MLFSLFIICMKILLKNETRFSNETCVITFGKKLFIRIRKMRTTLLFGLINASVTTIEFLCLPWISSNWAYFHLNKRKLILWTWNCSSFERSIFDEFVHETEFSTKFVSFHVSRSYLSSFFIKKVIWMWINIHYESLNSSVHEIAISWKSLRLSRTNNG